MSNMDASQREQIERADLGGSARGARMTRGSNRGIAIYAVISIVIAALLCYAAIEIIDSWAQWIVLGGILVTLAGLIVAVSPTRRTG